jgi:methyl-accepting chemotaxis protein
MDDDYEIIPTSPLRRLEKRINQVERTSTTSETQRLIEQIIELIKSNQRIIDDIIKADAELRDEMSKVPGKIDELLSSMHEFMEILKTSATEETVTDISKDVMQPLVNKMNELIEQNKKNVEVGQASLTSLGIIDKRLKRIYLQFANTATTNAYR